MCIYEYKQVCRILVVPRENSFIEFWVAPKPNTWYMQAGKLQGKNYTTTKIKIIRLYSYNIRTMKKIVQLYNEAKQAKVGDKAIKMLNLFRGAIG